MSIKSVMETLVHVIEVSLGIVIDTKKPASNSGSSPKKQSGAS